MECHYHNLWEQAVTAGKRSMIERCLTQKLTLSFLPSNLASIGLWCLTFVDQSIFWSTKSMIHSQQRTGNKI